MAAEQLKLSFLGSGSTGNATHIQFGATGLLLDCGFSGRELQRRLRRATFASTASRERTRERRRRHRARRPWSARTSKTPRHAMSEQWATHGHGSTRTP